MRRRGARGCGIVTDRGGVTAYHFVSGLVFDDPAQVSDVEPKAVPHLQFIWRRRGPGGAPGRLSNRFGAAHHSARPPGKPIDVYVATVPVWFPPAFFALPPLLWLATRSRRLYARRRRLGLCLRCGYDLQGNTSGRCSECGEAIEPVAAELRVTA